MMRELNPIPRDNLEGWGGVGGGRKFQGGRDICTPMFDSCLCMAETNTILESNYPPIKKNKTYQQYVLHQLRDCFLPVTFPVCFLASRLLFNTCI